MNAYAHIAGLTTIDDVTHRENRIRASYISGGLPALDPARLGRAELRAAAVAGAVLRPCAPDRRSRRKLAGPGKEGDRAPSAGAADRDPPVRRRRQAPVLADGAGGAGLPLGRPAAPVPGPTRGDLRACGAGDAGHPHQLVPGAIADPDPDPDRAGPCREPDSWARVVSDPDCDGAVDSLDSFEPQPATTAATSRASGRIRARRGIRSRPSYRRGRRRRRASARSACR